MQEKQKQKYLRFSDLEKQYSLPKSSVYDLIAKEGFPKQIKLSTQSRVFNREAVDKWFADKEAQSVGASS